MGAPTGYRRRSPCAVGVTTVALMVTAWAPFGTPQLPWIRKSCGPGLVSAAPPVGPLGERVSKTRQGVTGKYWYGPPACAAVAPSALAATSAMSAVRTIVGRVGD